MNKKIILAIIIILLPASIFASVLQLGGSVSWGVPVHGESSTPVDFEEIDFGKYDVGLDVMLNLSLIHI